MTFQEFTSVLCRPKIPIFSGCEKAHQFIKTNPFFLSRNNKHDLKDMKFYELNQISQNCLNSECNGH